MMLTAASHAARVEKSLLLAAAWGLTAANLRAHGDKHRASARKMKRNARVKGETPKLRAQRLAHLHCARAQYAAARAIA